MNEEIDANARAIIGGIIDAIDRKQISENMITMTAYVKCSAKV